MNRIGFAAAIALGALLAGAGQAHAQRPQQPDTAKPKTTREIVLEKLRMLDRAEQRDTTRRDTTQDRVPQRNERRSSEPAMDFPTDSVMRELIALPEYAATQYRGSGAVFVADSNQLVLRGTKEEKAGVVREGQTMTADSLLTFDESTSIACGYGNPVLAGEGADAPVESQLVCFNTREKVGMAVGARTQVSEGANWFITGDLYSRDKNMYAHNAKFTDCSLSEPHYHFAAKDVKIIAGNTMVARNVTLNFGDVPVFWLPFMPQSLKSGRRSGVLMPQFGINDIVRRNSRYKRRVSNIGFYWAMNDNMGSRLALDWFSGNYTALEGSFEYRFPRAFFSGGTTLKRFWEEGGSKQFSISTQQSWEPTERLALRIDGDYVTSTAFVAQRSFDPAELRRQIASNASITRRFDWAQLSLQASRRQDLTDERVELVLPSAGLSFPTVTLFPAVGNTHFYNNATWGGSAQMNRRATQRKGSDFNPSTVSANADSRFTMGQFSWSQTFVSDQRSDSIAFGESPLLAATQHMRWATSINYQQRLIGTTTFTPSITMSQDWERRDTLQNNRLFKAPVRMDVSASIKADLFGFYPGIGSISRIRHRISPSISYAYSPSPKSIADSAIIRALFNTGATRTRNTISIGLSQTIEGKYREDEKRDTLSADSAAVDSVTLDPTQPRRLPQARKVTILSLNTDAVMYDFTAAGLGEQAIQTTQITNSINSDLLRGLQLTLTHDLFEPLPAGSDPNAKKHFAPHLSHVSTNFSLNNNSWIFRLLGLGKKTDAPPEKGPAESTAGPEAEGAIQPTGAVRPEYGVIGTRSTQTGPTNRGTVGSWNASFGVSLDRPREIPGSPFPAQGNEMVTSQFNFQPTRNWGVNWSTGYSFSQGKFSDHMLTLTRQLHDWDANFVFTKGQNGNFSFVFNVKLRANPDIKFDYNQRSNVGVRRTPGPGGEPQ